MNTGAIDIIEAQQPIRRPLAVWLRRDVVVVPILLAIALLSWLPRRHGPIDLRWDNGVYYILGTSLAQGSGYRLLNEPGEIRAVQYPPLVPVMIRKRILASDDRDHESYGGG